MIGSLETSGRFRVNIGRCTDSSGGLCVAGGREAVPGVLVSPPGQDGTGQVCDIASSGAGGANRSYRENLRAVISDGNVRERHNQQLPPLMEEELKSLPLENASILSEGSLQDGHRLWIGNLDPKITEYHLLKLLQKFGKVKQFDFLFHKSGPLEGQPRGYCFVNFETKLEAEKAIQCLNGKMALSKKLVVRWAHAQIKRYDNYKSEKVLPISLEPSSSTEPTQSTLSVSAKIKAIEAKLKMMAENPDHELPGQPSYSYFKASEKKRSTPYSRTSWKTKR